MVAWGNRQVIDVPLADAIARPHVVDPADTLVLTARGLGISFGDESSIVASRFGLRRGSASIL